MCPESCVRQWDWACERLSDTRTYINCQTPNPLSDMPKLSSFLVTVQSPVVPIVTTEFLQIQIDWSFLQWCHFLFCLFLHLTKFPLQHLYSTVVDYTGKIIHCSKIYHAQLLAVHEKLEIIYFLRLVYFCCYFWNFTKSSTPPWVFFTLFKLYNWYQIVQNITNVAFCSA